MSGVADKSNLFEAANPSEVVEYGPPPSRAASLGSFFTRPVINPIAVKINTISGKTNERIARVAKIGVTVPLFVPNAISKIPRITKL